jgi:hypothetical protein
VAKPVLKNKLLNNKWLVLGIGVAAVVFVVGLVTILRGVGLAVTPTLTQVRGGERSEAGVAASVSKAKFSYLAPDNDKAWKLDDKSLVYDESKGVVKYQIAQKDGGATIVISQQKLPDDLKPQTSAKFTQFILASGVARSQEVGLGKVYFQQALLNGAPANGATTVIYATDDILLFGHAGMVLDYAKWSKLLGDLRMVSPK